MTATALALVVAGTAKEPLAEITDPCPACGETLHAELALPTAAELHLATALLNLRELAHYLAICEVHCDCGWRGSAFRPVVARSSLQPVKEEQ